MNANELDKLHLARLRSFLPALVGSPFAPILVLKGEPGAAEGKGLAPFSGPDGSALEKAFVSLGWGEGAWCGMFLGDDAPDGDGLLTLIDAFDPRVVVALDAVAAARIEALGCDLPSLGYRLVILDGFEASLNDDARKRAAWTLLKTLRK